MAGLKRSRVDSPLEGLLEPLEPRTRAVLARFRIPPQDAEDLLQQTFLTFLYKQDGIRDPEAWILGTLRNRCLMYWRSRRRRLYTAVDQALLEAVARPEEPEQNQREIRHDLDLILSGLSHRCRSMLRLRYGFGCNPPETARRLGYKPSGAYKLMERCLAALTRRMVDEGYAARSGGGADA